MRDFLRRKAGGSGEKVFGVGMEDVAWGVSKPEEAGSVSMGFKFDEGGFWPMVPSSSPLMPRISMMLKVLRRYLML